ncbi:MAG TPA: hypothetical protein VHE30_21050 [Polyangiaceae bacterium]|nr:hypothetical protein [Polyangiaceae bacterium]
MKALPLLFTLAVTGCGDDSSTNTPANSGGFPAGAGGYAADAGTGGAASGAGGTAPTTDAGSRCDPMSFSQAPLPCSQDISHAREAYPLPCDDPKAKGYLATCGDYDAVIAPDGQGKAYCFYAHQTGNLVGAIGVNGSGARVCMSFDLDFAAPATASCAPVVAGTCPP